MRIERERRAVDSMHACMMMMMMMMMMILIFCCICMTSTNAQNVEYYGEIAIGENNQVFSVRREGGGSSSYFTYLRHTNHFMTYGDRASTTYR